MAIVVVVGGSVVAIVVVGGGAVVAIVVVVDGAAVATVVEVAIVVVGMMGLMTASEIFSPPGERTSSKELFSSKTISPSEYSSSPMKRSPPGKLTPSELLLRFEGFPSSPKTMSLPEEEESDSSFGL